MALYAAALAVLEWFALALQLYLVLQISAANGQGPVQGVLNFFSYFTILSNLIVALVLTATRWSPRSRLGSFLARPTAQTAAAVYVTIVGVVYSLVLREIWDPRGLQKLADILLHDLLPLLYVIFWFVFVEKKSLRWMDALRWLSFPGLYLAYLLIRGAATSWYPYPFLDAGDIGYTGIVRSATMLVAAFLAVGATMVAIAKWLNRRALRQ